MRLWPMEEGYAPEMKGLSEEELRQGETCTPLVFAPLRYKRTSHHHKNKGAQQGASCQNNGHSSRDN